MLKSLTPVQSSHPSQKGTPVAIALQSHPSFRTSAPRSYATYFRRRVVLVAAVACVLGGAFFTSGAVAEKSTPAGIATPHTLTVAPGDTLWDIAHRLVPNGNITAMVDELVHLNGDQIFPGQVIRIP
jgi:nucleoid-associated protein YgaU